MIFSHLLPSKGLQNEPSPIKGLRKRVKNLFPLRGVKRILSRGGWSDLAGQMSLHHAHHRADRTGHGIGIRKDTFRIQFLEGRWKVGSSRCPRTDDRSCQCNLQVKIDSWLRIGCFTEPLLCHPVERFDISITL